MWILLLVCILLKFSILRATVVWYKQLCPWGSISSQVVTDHGPDSLHHRVCGRYRGPEGGVTITNGCLQGNLVIANTIKRGLIKVKENFLDLIKKNHTFYRNSIFSFYIYKRQMNRGVLELCVNNGLFTNCNIMYGALFMLKKMIKLLIINWNGWKSVSTFWLSVK